MDFNRGYAVCMSAQILQIIKEKPAVKLPETIADKQLYSVFQPIYSFSNQACVGAEVLLRGNRLADGVPLGAKECLKEPEGVKKSDYVRMMNQMHLKSWLGHKPPDSWLFLNLDIHEVKSLSEFCLGDLFEELNLKGYEVVIEIVESEIKDEELFEQLILILRNLGCLIALDDFGAGHSNIDRIWKAQPDIVKLDRQVLLEASKGARGQSILKNLTRLIKEAGSISLLEGIETQEQALLAMDVGVDLVQGFYFATPAKNLSAIQSGQQQVQKITERYPAFIKEKHTLLQVQKKSYEALFESLFGKPDFNALENGMKKVTQLSFVKRFFILDEFGYQVSEECEEANKTALDILKKGKGLCWKNRRYFLKALRNQSSVYVSQPYRSLIDMQLCLTVSRSILLDSGQIYVACFDLFYHDRQA